MELLSNWQPIAEYLQQLNTASIVIRLFLAMLFGAILGIDRTRKRRPAGFRTHMLVCMGSALVMMTNQYIVQEFNTSDPARLGAQVISGIGFLGAGTIIVTRHNQVVGLTTAAGLWASACIGLALGIGFYSAAIVAEAFILFIVIYMHSLDSWLQKRARVMELYTEFSDTSMLSEFLSFCSQNRIRVNHVEVIKTADPDRKNVAAVITLKLPKRYDHFEIMHKFSKADGLVHIEELH